MNINIWDVADDIERLVQSSRRVNVDDLANPGVPLASALRPSGKQGQVRGVAYVSLRGSYCRIALDPN